MVIKPPIPFTSNKYDLQTYSYPRARGDVCDSEVPQDSYIT